LSLQALQPQALRKAIEEALASGPPRRFKESVELIVVYDKGAFKPEELRTRETIFLPHPPKKEVKLCIAADGDLAVQARVSGLFSVVVDRAALDELSKNKRKAKKLAKHCDWVLVQRELMGLVGRVLGPALGPRGKVPVMLPPDANLSSAAEAYKRAVLAKMKDQPHVQVRIGTVDNTVEELVENAAAVLQALEAKFKDKRAKAVYVKKTMGPPVKLQAR